MRALVVTGGTEVDWDDVRVIANRSRGFLGMQIADWLYAKSVDTTCLISERALAQPKKGGAGWHPVSYRTYDDLVARLDEYLADGVPDFLFVPAAISDFAPVKVPGKVRSAGEEVTVTFRRLPKILATLRERCGIETFIVGFKLLCGVGEGTLVRAALEQTRSTRINLTVANDLEVLRRPENEGQHPAFMVTPEGGAIPVTGTKRDVAREIVDFCMKRHATTWARSRAVPVQTPREGAAFRQAADLLTFGQRSGLLRDHNGNVSARRGETGHLWATPRKVDKSAITPSDIIAAVHVEDEHGNRVEYEAEEGNKPSIDTQVHSLLYRTLVPQVSGILHFHEGYVVPDTSTDFPWPCGTREEYEEIFRVFDTRAPCVVELRHHGYLFCVEPGGGARLLRDWETLLEEWRSQIGDGFAKFVEDAKMSPIIVGGYVCGLVAETSTFVCPFFSSRTSPEATARGLGLLTEQVRTLAVPWGQRENYPRYRLLGKIHDSVALLVPHWVGVEEAAVGILEHEGRVLMLYRHVNDAAYPGALVFPGGRLDEGETPEEAVTREFKEETGIEVEVVRPCGLVTSYSKKALRLYRIRAYRVSQTGGELREFPTEEHRECWWFGPEAPDEIGHATKILFEDYWKERRDD